jgi:iron complex outermembrane receptor protein
MIEFSPKLLMSASAIALLASIAPSPVKAQSQSAGSQAASADQGAGLEEITVTARKRSEALLQVPVAVSAFDSQMIQQEGIENLNDIAALTPGFNIDNQGAMTSNSSRSTQTLVIRGMTPGESPTVTIFIDGAPVTSGFVDGVDALDRVEILKGPQSAYFGRETFAGAVNLVTKKPSDDLLISFDGLYGSNDWHDVRLTAEGAIVPGVLSIRASVRDYAQTGQYKNYGDAGGTLGDQSTRSATLAVYATPTDQLTIKAFGDVWHDEDGPSATGLLTSSQYNCSTPTGGGKLNYFCGALPQVHLNTLASDTSLDQIQRDALSFGITPNGADLLDSNTGEPYRGVFGPDQTYGRGGLARTAYHVHGEIDYELPDSGITITSLTAANMDHYNLIFDLDNIASSHLANPYYGLIPYAEPYQNWLFSNSTIQDDVSQEFRIASDQTNQFRWTLGTDYAHSLFNYSQTDNNPFGSGSLNSGAPLYTDTYSMFGSLAYDVMDDLTVSFDARYQLDHQITFNEHVVGPNTFVASGNFRSFMPRVIVQYKIDPDVMVYASWSQGANVGLLNTELTSLPGAILQTVEKNYGVSEQVSPEQTQQYELGIKGRFWDGRISLSTDIYGGTWTNQIVEIPILYALSATQSTELDAYTNVGKTDLFGWEFDGAIKPIDHLVINGSAGFAQTIIQSYVCAVCLTVTGTTNVKGNQLPDYPAWQANLGAEWSDELPMIEGLSYYVRGEMIYRSLEWADFGNTSYIPASAKANFRVGLKGENYSGEFFVLNAFDDKAYTNANQNVNLLSPNFTGLAIPVGMPLLRQFGVRVKYAFGGLHEEAASTEAAYAPPPVVAPAPAPTARSYMVFFDFNKSDLTPQAVSIVDTAAKNAGPAKVTQISVTGHTDTVGSDAYNMRLSRRRAESVAAELEKQGIPSSEIEIVAKGKKDLLVPTADGVREPQNRRVQIVYEGGATS